MNRLHRTLSRPFTLFDALGRSYRVQLLTAVPAIFSPTSALFLVVLTLLMWISDPQDYHDYMPWGSALFMWATGITLMILTYLGILLAWASLPLARRHTIPLLVASLPAIVASTAYHHYLGSMFSGGAWTQDLWPSHFYLLLIQQGFEVLYLRYGLPKSFQDIAARKDDSEPAPAPVEPAPEPAKTNAPPLLTLPGEPPLPITDVLLVRAQEHYIEVHTKRGDPRIIRARIADFVEQVTEDHGIQPHRSWWVSIHAAKELISENGKRFLELRNGMKIPVSRARLTDVQSWLDEL